MMDVMAFGNRTMRQLPHFAMEMLNTISNMKSVRPEVSLVAWSIGLWISVESYSIEYHIFCHVEIVPSIRYTPEDKGDDEDDILPDLTTFDHIEASSTVSGCFGTDMDCPSIMKDT